MTHLAPPILAPVRSSTPIHARIAVVIPAWNEEGSIGRVIDALPKDYVDRVIVADNNSTDYTATVARKFGATVVPATRQGYGSACLAALAHLVGDPPEIVVFIDADFSDHPEQLPLLVDPILAGQADFARLAPGGVVSEVADGGHYVHLDQPQVAAAAVLRVLGKVE